VDFKEIRYCYIADFSRVTCTSKFLLLEISANLSNSHSLSSV